MASFVPSCLKCSLHPACLLDENKYCASSSVMSRDSFFVPDSPPITLHAIPLSPSRPARFGHASSSAIFGSETQGSKDTHLIRACVSPSAAILFSSPFPCV